VNPLVAQAVAVTAHAGQRTRLGEPLVGHLRRVAARVPSQAVAIAWLHDVGERGVTSVHDLLARGITPAELSALELLTYTDGEDFSLYMRRIARANGEAGVLARAIKLAELEDHLSRLASSSSARGRYELAREEILRGQRRSKRRSAERRGVPA